MLKVSTIIPHAGGWDILEECLRSLSSTRDVEFETIIVENGSFERLDPDQLQEYSNVQILHYECKLGFAGACNRGVEASRGEFVFLLNNDAVVEPDTIRKLVEVISGDDTIAACQPKILSLLKPGKFDYSSAAGGEIDRFGFPFARGRIFDHLEDDNGQYDRRDEIFWGAGAALMIRRSLYLDSGGLDETFFAHMEEIDLLWRLQLMGHRVITVPDCVVKHRGAVTIKTDSQLKMFLNHRNSLVTIFRNYNFWNLLKNLPIRFMLDFIALIQSFVSMKFGRALAIFRANVWFWFSIPYLIRARRKSQRLRKVPDTVIRKRIFQGSIVWRYFVMKQKTWTEITSR